MLIFKTCKYCGLERSHLVKELCENCYWKDYRRININRIMQRDREYYRKNKKNILAQHKEYREKHKEEIKNLQKESFGLFKRMKKGKLPKFERDHEDHDFDVTR